MINNKRILQIETLNNHKTVCKILKLNKIQYFTYQKQKRTKLFLKDLEGDFDTKIVLQELLKKNIENLKFISVKKFSTKISIAENRSFLLYIVQISPDSK